MKLKNFIYIDNDDATDHNAERNLNYAKKFIEQCGIPEFNWDDHQKQFGYWRLNRDEQIDLLLGTSKRNEPQIKKDDILVTWSVYTVGQMSNSRMQILNTLTMFGRNDIHNRVYLDTSGMLKDTIHKFLSDYDAKGHSAVIKAIENNYIITTPVELGYPERLRINTNVIDYKDNWYKTEAIDIASLLYENE